MPKYTHIHKYYLAKMGSRPWKIYRCAVPGCPHFIPVEKMVYNRQSICWECGDVFILGQRHRRVVKPKCDTCRKGGRESRVDRGTIAELAERLGKL
jgi:hypothetical protein